MGLFFVLATWIKPVVFSCVVSIKEKTMTKSEQAPIFCDHAKETTMSLEKQTLEEQKHSFWYRLFHPKTWQWPKTVASWWRNTGWTLNVLRWSWWPWGQKKKRHQDAGTSDDATVSDEPLPAQEAQVAQEPIQIQVTNHVQDLIKQGVSTDLQDADACVFVPENVLKAFQDWMENKNLLGKPYVSAYDDQEHKWPEKKEDLTGRHLHMMARNEDVNTTGTMNLALYPGLTAEDVGLLRVWVKRSPGVGLCQATHYGGYPENSDLKEYSQQVIIVDQCGFQWQDDPHNTGYLFVDGLAIGRECLQFQEKARACFPEDNDEYYGLCSDVVCGKDVDRQYVRPSRLNKNRLEQAFAQEFLDALYAVEQHAADLFENGKNPRLPKNIHFRFLKAGMGFFSEGLHFLNPEDAHRLELIRLRGIQLALRHLCLKGRDARPKWVKRLELPYSELQDMPEAMVQCYKKLMSSIFYQASFCGMNYVEDSKQDALAPVEEGYLLATTNCGDPHAMIGNEGGRMSVDANIACNADVRSLNAAMNHKIRTKVMPPLQWISRSQKEHDEKTPADPTRSRSSGP